MEKKYNVLINADCGCGCKETVTTYEDHRDCKDYPHIDRCDRCPKCGALRLGMVWEPDDGKWDDIWEKIFNAQSS